jgi:hypothetical protein
MSDQSYLKFGNYDKHIRMSNESKRTHFKFSSERIQNNEFMSTQRDAFQMKNNSEIVQPTINALEFKKTHFKMGFQKSSFETSNSASFEIGNFDINQTAKENHKVIKPNVRKAKLPRNSYEQTTKLDYNQIDKYSNKFLKLYGSPVQKSFSRDQKYQTTNQTYTHHDVTQAFVMAEESKQKGFESKRSHFSFGYLIKSPPKTAANINQRLLMKVNQQKSSKMDRSIMVLSL